MWRLHTNICVCMILRTIYYTKAQFAKDSFRYNQAVADGQKSLSSSVESRKDTISVFHPSKLLLPNSDYILDVPPPASYKIKLMIDPCSYLNYTCCMNTYGTAEYPSLILDGLENERIIRYNVLANESDVKLNYQRVYEDGTVVADGTSRYPDDESVYDPVCIGKRNPYNYCAGRNYAFIRSSLRPTCTDNNSTLNALDSCTYMNGTQGNKCVQIGYHQNAFIAQCNPDFKTPICGTFLEIHMPGGTPYKPEDTVINEVQLDIFNTSGVSTTVLPTTWMGNPKRVLCAYQETYFRPGSPVYITASAPVCCCPRVYDSSTQLGSFFCPDGTTGVGPYAMRPQTLSEVIEIDNALDEYPYCLSTPQSSDIDNLLISDYDETEQRSYVRPAMNVTQNSTSLKYSSQDLAGSDYPGICPYFSPCALSASWSNVVQDNSVDDYTSNAIHTTAPTNTPISVTSSSSSSSSSICEGLDQSFTFAGRSGIVTEVVPSDTDPAVWVTFNKGRTAYLFPEIHVQLDYRKRSMYEVWWVVRSRSERRIQSRKGFNVTSPECTFDLTNNRYFPYAELDENGDVIANMANPDDDHV